MSNGRIYSNEECLYDMEFSRHHKMVGDGNICGVWKESMEGARLGLECVCAFAAIQPRISCSFINFFHKIRDKANGIFRRTHAMKVCEDFASITYYIMHLMCISLASHVNMTLRMEQLRCNDYSRLNIHFSQIDQSLLAKITFIYLIMRKIETIR